MMANTLVLDILTPVSIMGKELPLAIILAIVAGVTFLISLVCTITACIIFNSTKEMRKRMKRVELDNRKMREDLDDKDAKFIAIRDEIKKYFNISAEGGNPAEAVVPLDPEEIERLQKEKAERIAAEIAENERREKERRETWNVRLLEDYNAIGDDINAPIGFINNYAATGLMAKNKDEMEKNPGTMPNLGRNDDTINSNFWAVSIDWEQDTHLVFPHKNVALDEQSIKASGIKEIFDTNFSDGKTYSAMTIKKPAVFIFAADKWECQKRGEVFFKEVPQAAPASDADADK